MFVFLNVEERARNFSESIFPWQNIFPKNSHAPISHGDAIFRRGGKGLANFRLTPGVKFLGVGFPKNMKHVNTRRKVNTSEALPLF